MAAALPIGNRQAIRRAVTATSFGFALVQLDVTIVNVALPHIGTDLGAGVAGLQWVVDAYALVFAALLLTAGFLGDRLGARRVYLAGLGLFALASLGCGLSASTVGLIAGRAVQGIGAAAMLPFALMPAGMGAGIPAATVAVLASVAKERTGIASAVFNAARQAAGAMGVALFGAFAGGDQARIVVGLHVSALVGVAVLVTAATLAAFGLAKSRAVSTSP